MIARRESRVAARTASGLAAGARSAIFVASLASTAGHRPSMADSQSGRAAAGTLGVQAGLATARWTASVCSWNAAKKARQDGSTEPGSPAHRA